jgi:hypothetical protein
MIHKQISIREHTHTLTRREKEDHIIEQIRERELIHLEKGQ